MTDNAVLVLWVALLLDRPDSRVIPPGDIRDDVTNVLLRALVLEWESRQEQPPF